MSRPKCSGSTRTCPIRSIARFPTPAWRCTSANGRTSQINRPHAMNAGTIQTWGEINHTLDRFAEDDEVRVVVLTGTGRAFSAGDDVKEIFLRRQKSGEDHHDNVVGEAEALRRHEPVGLDRLVVYPKPTIASINGVAVGS